MQNPAKHSFLVVVIAGSGYFPHPPKFGVYTPGLAPDTIPCFAAVVLVVKQAWVVVLLLVLLTERTGALALLFCAPSAAKPAKLIVAAQVAPTIKESILFSFFIISNSNGYIVTQTFTYHCIPLWNHGFFISQPANGKRLTGDKSFNIYTVEK